MKFSTTLFSVIAAASFAGSAHAAITMNDWRTELTGTTSYDSWDDISQTNFASAAPAATGGYPGTGAWTAPLTPNEASAGGAALSKVTGTSGYIPSSGMAGPGPQDYIYTPGGFAPPYNTVGGVFSVSDSTPITDLETVILNLAMNGSFATTGFTMGGVNNGQLTGGLPVLNYNGGSQMLVFDLDGFNTTTVSGGVSNGSSVGYYSFQWDLSSILTPITSFEVVWTTTQHTAIYGAELMQGTVFAEAVPEPSRAMLGFVALGALMMRRSRRKITA